MKTYMERINIIADECFARGIPFHVHQIFEGWQITFPWCEGDVACHDGTYGAHSGYVESLGFPWDRGDVSVMKPKKMARKIVKYYKKKEKRKKKKKED